jgi:hypothetical protein
LVALKTTSTGRKFPSIGDWKRENKLIRGRSIIRRAAVLTTELERLEVRFAQAGEASAEDLDIYARIAANLRRLLEAIGLQRRPRDVTPPDPLIYAAQQDKVA